MTSIPGWQELTDTPFAATLAAHHGGLADDSLYDGAHFSEQPFRGGSACHSRFLECAFTGIAVTEERWRQASFRDIWMRDVRLTGTDLAETSWADAVITSSVLAGVAAYGGQWRRVTFRDCKLDGVNLRGTQWSDAVFERCLLRDVDFTDASLTRVAFRGTRLAGADFTRAAMDKADLRGADLEVTITISPESLRGAIVTPAQLGELAPLLAASLGITVADDEGSGRPSP